MFKLESYITPIILSYVEKYVKDVKADRSQVSLWNGGASFSNLDLRLDVLEQELGIPFSFVSGHIHELHISVPWTRLNTEPIVITINTIECVLKLPDKNDGGGGTESESSARSASPDDNQGSQQSSKSKRINDRSGKTQQEAPPGYVQSLINKIISNVKIVCNNLILKYVEEDIVLSLNTRYLCLSSANEIWEPSFVELSTANGLVLRKLLQVKDMTICLDKRNASGKIETYQEPLLYRSSLSVHAAWCYDSALSKIPRTTRYDIRSERLDFSLTDTQMPMFLRILNLLLAFYYGDLHQRNQNIEKDNFGNDCAPNLDSNLGSEEISIDQTDQFNVNENNESWSGWAWNMGSSVGTALLPVYWEDETSSGDFDVPYLTIKKDKVFHLGIYVDSASLILKLTERQREKNLFGSTKLCFSPFAKIDVLGFVQEVVVKGINTCNVSGGLSYMQLVPLGDCVCGAKDTAYIKPDNEATFTRYMIAGSDTEETRRNFIRDSLFVKDFGHEEENVEPKERRRIYAIDWDEHLEQVTEELMLEKTAAVAIDYLYHFDIPDDFTSEQLSELGTDLENSNLTEKALCRIVFGPTNIKLCSGSLHRMNMVSHFLSSYDYLPYFDASLYPTSPNIYKDKVQTSSEQNPVEEDNNIDNQNNPLRVYQITAINPSLRLFLADHPKFTPSQFFHLRNTNKSSPAQSPVEELPQVDLKMEYVDAQITQPMYPSSEDSLEEGHNINDQSNLKNCLLNINAKLLNVSCHLANGGQSTTLVQPSNLQMGYKKWLSELSKNNQDLIKEHDYAFELQTLRMRSTKAQTLLAYEIVNSFNVAYPKPAKLFESSLVEDAMTKRIASLSVLLTGARFQYSLCKTMVTIQLTICDITANVTSIEFPNLKTKLIPLLSVNHSTLGSAFTLPKSCKMSPSRRKPASDACFDNNPKSDRKIYLRSYVQIPISAKKQDVQTIVFLEAEDLHLNLDPKLYDWFLYSPAMKERLHNVHDSAPESKQEHSEMSVTKTDNSFDASGAVHHEVKAVSTSAVGNNKPEIESKEQKVNRKETKSMTGNSEKETLKTSQKKSKGLNRSVSNIRDYKEGVEMNKYFLDLISKWFPTLNTALVQLRMNYIHIFIPKRSLDQVANKNVLDTVTRASKSKQPLPLMCLVVPTITIENVAHKPAIEQFLSQAPIILPESLWNIKRDNLPWTIQLQDFAIFTCSNGAAIQSFILQPVHTSCTLGLNSRHHSDIGGEPITPTLGICLHADTTAIKMSINDTQLCLAINIFENFLLFVSSIKPDILCNFTSSNVIQEHCIEDGNRDFIEGMSSDRHIKMPDSTAIREESPKGSEKIGDTISEKTRSIPVQTKNQRSSSNKVQSEDYCNDALSLWVQWTLPQIRMAAISEAIGQNGNVVKLELDMEDYLSSFDWTPVYFQMKMRILTSNIHHFVKSQSRSENDWRPGRFKGIVLSCTDDLTHDLHTVNVNNNNIEILPHTRHFEASQTFFSATFTRAECKNVHSKWKDLLRNKTFYSILEKHENKALSSSALDKRKRFVSEMDIKIAPFDIVIANEVWVPFFKMASHLFSMRIPASFLGPSEFSGQKIKGVWGMGVNNNTMPLVYVKAKTIRILLLTKSKEDCRNPDKIDLSHAALNPDMMIFKCDSISITPQVENMLSRILIHPELFHLSRSILSIPGSPIEDRQYQLDAIGLSLLSGRWCDIERKSEKRPKTALKTMGENPALEWNDGTITNEADKKVDEVFLMPCLAPFDLQITFAPAIVYETVSFVESQARATPIFSEKLIAGMSLEINAKSEIVFTTSLNQISLMSLFVQESITIYNSLLYLPTSSGITIEQRKVPDSGVDGDETSENPNKQGSQNNNTTKSRYPNIVPSELLITGSKISCILFKLSEGSKSGATNEDKAMWRKYRYKQRRLEIIRDRREEYPLDNESEGGYKIDPNKRMKNEEAFTSNSEHKCDVGYEGSEEGSVEEPSDLIVKIFPLLCCLIKQPHLFISYTKPHKNRFEVSIYDASLNMSPVNYFITCGGHRVPGTLDYQNQLFQTKLGEPNPKSGIPPALFTLTAKNFLEPNVASISCKMERPIKIHLNFSLWKQLFGIFSSIKESCGLLEIMQLLNINDSKGTTIQKGHVNSSLENNEKSVILLARQYFSNVKDICFETKQVMLTLATSMHQKISKSQKDDFAQISLVASEIEASCKMSSRSVGESYLVDDIKLNFSLKKLLNHVSIGTYNHRFFGPCTVEFDFSTYWQDAVLECDPSFIIKFVSDAIAIHVGPNHILSLVRLNQHFKEELESYREISKIDDRKQDSTNETPSFREENNCENLASVTNDSTVQEPTRQNVQSFVQNYIDDLRAGAFQYVEDNSKMLANEPKPYQVIFSKNPPAMTWKYPQPRTLTRVSVFPVPFKLASELGSANVGNEEEVSCALQYFDKCTKSFRTYSEFNLSEQNVCHLDLPLSKDLKKMVMASTWRVLLDSQDEYQDFDQLERQIIVTPKSLVSVIRVDSYVNQNLVPRIQASVAISQIVLYFHNHLHFCGYSLPITAGPKFNLDQVFPLDHKIGSLRLDGTTCAMESWLPDGLISSNMLAVKKKPFEIQLKARIDTQLQMEYVDYSFLLTHHILLPCTLHLKSFAVKKTDVPLLLESEMHVKKALVRVGHFFSRTFSITKDIWETAFANFHGAISSDTTSIPKRSIVPMTDYVICNNTQDSIRFGQADTEENILLRPSEAHMYAWRSQRTRLHLRLCVEGLGYWRWCESFNLEYGTETPCKARFRSIDHGTHITTLVITMKKMGQNESGCNQYHVMISGLISTASLLRDHLEVRAVLHKHGAALAAAATVSSTSTHDHQQQQHRTILGSFCVAPAFLLQPEYVQGIKIRLLGIGTPWSGDIPLSIEKGRRNSVLVRVPLKEKGQCLTIWCRVVEEKHKNEVSRCLLIFSPMYMSRSLLPNPISLLVYLASNAAQPAASSFNNMKENTSFSYEVTLPGKETSVQLETTGASDQKYNLSFQVVPGLPPSDPVTMSWGTIEKIRDKSYDTPPIDDILCHISRYAKSTGTEERTLDITKESSKLWPYINVEVDNIEWAPSVQPRTDVQVRFVQFNPLCNTLCVELVPWCLMINMTGVTILIKDNNCLKGDDERATFQLTTRSVFVPPTAIVTSTFHIGLMDDDGKEWFGPPLQMTNQQWNFKRRSVLMPAMEGMIPIEGIIHTHIICGGQICYLSIQTRDENGIRILNLKPTFTISNCLMKPITVASVSSSKKHMCSQDYVNFLGQDIPSTSITNQEVCVPAEPLLYWQILDTANNEHFNNFQLVSFCLSQHWSTALNLGNCIDLDEDIRISVSLSKETHPSEENFGNNETIPRMKVMNELLFVSLHQRQGTVYIVLQPDSQPQYIVHNCVSLPLCFIEQETGLNRYASSINHPKIIHEVGGLQSYLYSSVFASSTLSKVECMDSAIQIGFSAIPGGKESITGKEIDKNIDWSEWFDISNSNKYLHEYFIRIPGYGDVAIHLEKVGNTCHMYINPISILEVPAKEIRSRILASSQAVLAHNQASTVTRVKIPYPELASIPISPATSETSDLLETSTNGDESFVTIPALDKSKNIEDQSFHSVKSPAVTVYGSCDNSLNPSTLGCSDSRKEVHATAFFDEICIVLSDDCRDSQNNVDEYLRVTMDCVCISQRPRKGYSKPLKCLNDMTPSFNDILFTVLNLQFDNQMYRKGLYDFPAIVSGQEQDSLPKFKFNNCLVSDHIIEMLKENSLITLALTFDGNCDEGNILKSVHMKMKPLNVFIEDTFIYKLNSILTSFDFGVKRNTPLRTFHLKVPDDVFMSSQNLARHLCLDSLKIENLSVLVNLHASMKMYIGLDQSPLHFSMFERHNFVTTSYALGQSLARHYISGALFRSHWVVGSLDLIGSPSGFTRTVGEGVKDFVALPYQGIFQGPWSFISGLTNGSSSLVKHISAGTITSMTNFASSISRNLDRLSLDDEHCKRNEVTRRTRPQGFGEGLANGLSGVGIGLLGAIGGIAHHPLQAWLDETNTQSLPTGIVTGVARGLVGVVMKPLGGAAELVAQTGQGLLHGTGWYTETSHRSTALPEPICSIPSSELKYIWKMQTPQQSNTNVLFTADVTKVMTKSMNPLNNCDVVGGNEISVEQLIASSLLLTPDMIHVISIEEDVQESAYAIEDLEIIYDNSDPTKFLLDVEANKSEKKSYSTLLGIGTGDESHPHYISDRVVQFVMESGAHCAISDVDGEYSDGMEIGESGRFNNLTNIKSKKRTKSGNIPGTERNVTEKKGKAILFHASPVVITAFRNIFSVALAQKRNKGFETL